MKETIFSLLILLLSIAGLPFNVDAEEESPRVVSRSILALYDSSENPTADVTRIHKKMEVFLNHLGCTVLYHDITQGLPTDDDMKRYRGIITWFSDNTMPNPEGYLQWLAVQIDKGIRVAMLGWIGAQIDQHGNPVEQSYVDAIYRKFGVEFMDNTTDEVLKIDLVYKDSPLIEFERKLDFEIDYYLHLRQFDQTNKNYLVLKRNDISDSESPVVFTAKAGGIVSPYYVLYRSEEDDKTKLRINPFIFFREAFNLQGLPVPDVTTRNGIRVLFSHIDGDAFISLSRFDTTRLCAEVILDEVLRRYTIPISVSVVVGELVTGGNLPWIKGEKDLNQIAREIYSLPHIQPASHTFSHPLDWQRKIVAIHVPGYSEIITEETQDILEDSNYESLTMELSMTDVSDKQLAEKELLGSLEYINTELLSGTNKKCNLVFWSGNCIPQESVHAVAKKHKIYNINGGDPLFDDIYDSYTHLCALSRPVPTGRQVYTAACNENIYTELWSGPFYGFASVIDTFKRTESPVRIKPMNIYYHFYSGERAASLAALQKAYDYALSQDSFPIYTSEYIDMVYDWMDTKIYALQDGAGYRITNAGMCRTLRIDDETRFPDLARSVGVVGFLFYQNSLYVHLDDSGKYELWLSDTEPAEPYLAKSTGELRNYTIEPASIAFDVFGFGIVHSVFKNLIPNREYSITTADESISVQTDSFGTLEVSLSPKPQIKAGYHVKITLQDEERL